MWPCPEMQDTLLRDHLCSDPPPDSTGQMPRTSRQRTSCATLFHPDKSACSWFHHTCANSAEGRA